MREREYVFLDLKPRSGMRRRGTRSVNQPLEADVKIESLTPAQAAKLREDGRRPVPAVPLKLVRPQARGAVPRPSGAGAAWGVEAVGAMKSTCTGAKIKVAVLDTGIDADHEAFSGLTITQEDFAGSGHGDSDGHGTHCAGTIAGQTTDGQRLGVAPGIEELLVGKVIGPNGAS